MDSFDYEREELKEQAPIQGAIKVTLIGITAAAAAFSVAKFFGGMM